MQYADGGPETLSLTEDGVCAGVAVHPSGHCALTQTLPGRPCSADMIGCRAPCGLSSNDPQLWRTLAHELGHALGAPHSFASGGLMSYTGEAAFSEGAEVCAAISSHLEGRGGCLRAATAVCGDGVLDFGEACDDGNTAGGDGLA